MKNKKAFSIAVCLSATLLGSVLFVACNEKSQHQHDYAASITQEATCTEDGVKTFTCECGDTYTEAIPALDHDYKVTASIAANCTEPEKEQVKCERCNEETVRVKEGGQPALGHDWITDATIPATCDEPEKVHQTCNRTDCDAERTVNKEGGQTALGHHYVADESTRTEPDCTHDGGVTMKCDREGCTDSYWEVTPALGHTDDGTKSEVHQATCEEEGYTVRHCSVCDTDYKTDNIAPLGHDYQADGQVVASCDTIGYDKYTCSHGCGIEKRENIVQNTEHSFNDSGVCTQCGKSATETMALLARTTTPIEIVSVGNGVYEVYGMREKEHVIYIPYNVIEALVKQGVESIIINVGAATPSDPISVLAKIDGETKLNANFGAGQTGEVATLKIGENGQVASSINSDGIALTVFYHDNYLNKVNRYVVGLTYVHAFDSQDVQTWYQTSLDVSGAPEDKIHLFSGMEDQAYYKLTVRPELIGYYAEQGAKSVKFSFISKEGQRVIFAVDYTVGDKGVALPAANYSLDVPELEITDETLQSGVTFRILFADCSLLPEWESANLDKADGFKLQTLLVKEYNASDASTYFDSAASWTANSALNEFTFSNCDIGNNTIIKIRPQYFADLANKGFSQAVVTLSNKSGQDLTFSVVLDKNYMAKGSVSFTLDITDELKTDGISLPVYTTDNGGNADGFVMRIDKVYAFDENNPVTFISAQGTDGVAYADNVWTFDKTVTSIDGSGDYYQNFTVSKQIVALWIEKGYAKMIIDFAPKSGESMDMRFDTYHWEVNLADYLESGFTKSPFVAPRTEPGITGFKVTIELTEAFDASKPEKFITVPDTDGVTYENGVWTVAKTAAYAADFYQDVVVSGDAIAYWMEQGYAKMTFAVSTKSGENTVIMYDGDFVYTVTFTEDMKTDGYTFSHVFIAPRSDSGMTGFNVTLELTEAFDANKPEKFITVPDTDGVTYENGVWTVAKTAAYAADFYQDVTVKPEAIAYWMEQGYAKMTFAVSTKSGENTVIMYDDGFVFTVTFTEEMKTTGYTFAHVFIGPRSDSGMTGFNVTLELTEAFDENKPEKFVTAEGAERAAYADNVWTFDRAGTHYDQYFTVKAEAIQKWIADGYGKMIIDIKAKDGETLEQNPAFNIVCHWEVDLEEYKTEGFTDKTFIAKVAEDVTGFKVVIQLVEKFDSSNPEKFITADGIGVQDVTYANNVWTFNKEITEDYNQMFSINADVIAYWAEQGKTDMWVVIEPKMGEYLDFRSITNSWCVSLASCKDGFTQTVYMPPRNSGLTTVSAISGFRIMVTFYDENDPSTFVWTTDATAISQQNGSWTFTVPTTQEDYYADVYVNAKAIAAWMDKGYTSMTIKVNAKSGEYLGLKVSDVITFTEEMRTSGYKHQRVYIAPRNASGGYGDITGYVVQIDLGGYTEDKPVTYIHAKNVGGVTYDAGTNSWIFARSARSYSADPYVLEDFDQTITITKEAIAKWVSEGKTSMRITISDKDGESSLDASSKVTKEISLADCGTDDYSFTQYMAVRGTNGITGFKVTITLN